MNLNQFFTPVWAAEILFQEHFGHLTKEDLLWEPACGKGSFLSAVPSHIPAVGSDIDANMVETAQANTGRQVYHGDFRTIKFPKMDEVTCVFGNPPFELKLFEKLLERCEALLNLGNSAGFILPAYFFQTSATFMRMARKWDISQEIIPRDLFKTQGLLSKPLIFAKFLRDDNPVLFGFRLHRELCDVNTLKEEYRQLVTNGVKRTGSIWREALTKVAKDAGGTITLEQAYKELSGKRPTPNPFWKEQIRKVIQQAPFVRIDEAKYQLT
jgi:predicted RNA methylase